MKLTIALPRAVAIMATLACLNLPAHAEVSWMDIISDPDNQALNEQFVTERLAQGDLPAALSAVERLINLRPADVGLRLIRAEILVNLGNDTLATGELDALAQLPMADEQKSRVRELQAVIEGRAKRWRTIVSGTIGLNGSDNANSYPSSGLLEFKAPVRQRPQAPMNPSAGLKDHSRGGLDSKRNLRQPRDCQSGP